MMSVGRTDGTDAGARPVARIRVMTVDDHPVFRDGLAALLALYLDFELVAEAGNGAIAVAQHRLHHPDVTLMDLSMPVMGGADAIAAIIAESPTARIIALTTFQGDADIHRALEAGAKGYLLKDALRNEIADAIRRVHRGDWALPNTVAQRLASFSQHAPLTDRELEVLKLMAKGLRNREIAVEIGRSEATVKVHVMHVIQKLGVADRTEAVVVGLKRGIIHLD